MDHSHRVEHCHNSVMPEGLKNNMPTKWQVLSYCIIKSIIPYKSDKPIKYSVTENKRENKNLFFHSFINRSMQSEGKEENLLLEMELKVKQSWLQGKWLFLGSWENQYVFSEYSQNTGKESSNIFISYVPSLLRNSDTLRYKHSTV